MYSDSVRHSSGPAPRPLSRSRPTKADLQALGAGHVRSAVDAVARGRSSTATTTTNPTRTAGLYLGYAPSASTAAGRGTQSHDQQPSDLDYDYDYEPEERGRGRARSRMSRHRREEREPSRSYYHDARQGQHHDARSHHETARSHQERHHHQHHHQDHQHSPPRRPRPHHQHSGGPSWNQAAKAALAAGVVEGLRSRGLADRAQRIAVAAAGAAVTDAFIAGGGRDGDRHETRHVVESTLGGLMLDRVVNGKAGVKEVKGSGKGSGRRR